MCATDIKVKFLDEEQSLCDIIRKCCAWQPGRGEESCRSTDGPWAQDLSCSPIMERSFLIFFFLLCLFYWLPLCFHCSSICSSFKVFTIDSRYTYTQWHLSPILVVCTAVELCQQQPGSTTGYAVCSTYVYDHDHVTSTGQPFLYVVICFGFFF